MSEKSDTLSKKQIEEAFAEAVREDNLCSLGKILADSPHGDILRAKVDDALTYSGPTISRVFKALGFPPVSSETVLKHRRGACRCLRTD